MTRNQKSKRIMAYILFGLSTPKANPIHTTRNRVIGTKKSWGTQISKVNLLHLYVDTSSSASFSFLYSTCISHLSIIKYRLKHCSQVNFLDISLLSHTDLLFFPRDDVGSERGNLLMLKQVCFNPSWSCIRFNLFRISFALFTSPSVWCLSSPL